MLEDWTPTPFDWLLLLLILIPLTQLAVRWWDRRKARSRADRIIHNEQPATVSDINKCIDELYPRASLRHGHSGKDVLRVEQLRAIRDRIE